MSDNKSNLAAMPLFNKPSLKSIALKADDQDKNPDTKSFVSPHRPARNILPNEKVFDATALKNFSKKVDDALEKMVAKTQKFCTKLSCSISRLLKGYFRILLVCAIVTIGYGFLFNLVEANPAIVENVPAIATLLNSAKVLANYTGEFLHMNVEWAIELIEYVIAQIGSTSI